MPHPLQITYGPYTVIRLPAGGAEASHQQQQHRFASATYVVRRADGSVCCEGVTWPEVERAIHTDEQSRVPDEPQT